jgi:hypothetical protein
MSWILPGGELNHQVPEDPGAVGPLTLWRILAESQDMTISSGQPVQDSQDKTARRGQTAGQPGQDIKNTARSKNWPAGNGKTAVTGKP